MERTEDTSFAGSCAMCIKAAFIDVIVSISVRQRCNNTSMV